MEVWLDDLGYWTVAWREQSFVDKNRNARKNITNMKKQNVGGNTEPWGNNRKLFNQEQDFGGKS